MEISRGLGVTVIYVTHDPEEALFMSHRIAVYHRGRIQQIGTPSELYERPASAFVAGFVGDSNMFTGPVDRNGPVPTMHVGGSSIRLDGPQAGRATGDTLTVVVRPERLRVSRPGAKVDEPRAVTMAGQIREAIYLGSVRKYVMDLAQGGRAVSRIQTGSGTDDLAVGAPVEVSWELSDGVLVAGARESDEDDPDRGSPEGVPGR